MGGIRLDEVFWAWEPPRRIGFCVTRTNNPMISAFAECYDITSLGEVWSRRRLRWRMAMELRGPLRFIAPSMRLLLGWVQLKMLAKLEPLAARFPRGEQSAKAQA